VQAVQRLAAHWPLGLATSSPTALIDDVLQGGTDLHRYFAVTLSTEGVARGKPAPDIYLAVADRLGHAPKRCVAVEDSSNGLRSAAAAGLYVIAVPHPRYPPDADALGVASIVLTDLNQLTPDVITQLPGQ
jgi:beta-phosphoglucomutase-like phosphatase (HAD superfamily)